MPSSLQLGVWVEGVGESVAVVQPGANERAMGGKVDDWELGLGLP